MRQQVGHLSRSLLRMRVALPLLVERTTSTESQRRRIDTEWSADDVTSARRGAIAIDQKGDLCATIPRLEGSGQAGLARRDWRSKCPRCRLRAHATRFQTRHGQRRLGTRE